MSAVGRVVFLPGAGGDPGFWTPVAERLPASLDCVRLAWPGLGSQPARDDVRGIDDLVRLTLDVIDRPVALVAQSMGGIVAAMATLARPELVQRLVLVATSGGVDISRFGASDWRPEYRAAYPGAAPWILDVRVDLTDGFPAIAAPTLLVWGDADPGITWGAPTWPPTPPSLRRPRDEPATFSTRRVPPLRDRPIARHLA